MRRRNERGSMAVEFVTLAPILMLLAMGIMAGGRWVMAYLDVEGAAYPAARAASLDRDTSTAARSGYEAALERLNDRDRSCANLSVSVDTVDYRAGGAVRATVICQVDLGDLGLPLGTRTFRSTATVPIEQYRSMGALP